ncbi:Spx/MgsR family RNA polymerase-binding regulatory protein [Candidatus Thioglobus sp.]|jgi:arsenate reductase|uniref:Spx/MgsR family RNA polymerase-binding regulatory protein n=1 Tax=Candidatus Thioglobus sp. TaxID=2026721 RepID=UPI000A8624F4|nr:Spx/MgsR family RNA polymerase-binding regulatory protein [Candidatus Thioglobus sp.]MBT3186037.1 Spx/MgsR family RNA polymerase-binding regulatory protein [Candidatus Thioglobus sp.]MBT3186056.1 Spx/MgsR family RNA polymerase-binding regulatory protein [Candidatus Thioglobus sp.]MBT5287273.1 Spx/MgsR family RNA polymerase-binding regulatory protein [Candidatus Thioglobus sp.]
MIKMYGIKNCDTIKKAQRFLKAQGVNFEFIDFRDQPIDEKTLQSFVDALGWDQLINKRSTTYRNLTDKEKKDITLELTLKKPTLIKRPVLVTTAGIRVGFSEKSYSSFI